MSGRPELPPGLGIRGTIAWLATRVTWIEEAAVEERWLMEQNRPVLDALEEKLMSTTRRELSRKGR